MKLIHTIPAAVAVLALLCGCVPAQPQNHSSSRGDDEHCSTRDAELDLPDVIGVDADSGVERWAEIGFTTDFPRDPDILVVSYNDSTVYEFTRQGCILDLREGSLTSLGIELGGDDALLTAQVLVGFAGELAPDAILSAVWPVNGDESKLIAVLGVGANDEGRPVIGVARAIGAHDRYLYSEFTCTRAAVDVVYSNDVSPYIGVEISGD